MGEHIYSFLYDSIPTPPRDNPERDDVFKWVWGVLADDDTSDIGNDSVEKIAGRIRQAEADREVLAKEVMAWRHSDDTHPEGGGPHPQHDRACEAAQRTDASGALERAGGK